jgi:hypothetical protein
LPGIIRSSANVIIVTISITTMDWSTRRSMNAVNAALASPRPPPFRHRAIPSDLRRHLFAHSVP